jgi:serine phosphatase RsbU (regulator of sigma subunit)
MDTKEHKRRISTIAFVLIVAILVSIAGLYFYNIVEWSDYPDFGYGFHTGTGIHTVGVVTSNGETAGLQVGDEIIEINGQTFTTIAELRKYMRRELGEENTYLLERQGQSFAVTIKNIPTGFKGSFSRSGLSFTLGLCYIFIGFLVFLMKSHQKTSWIFFLVTCMFGIYLIFLFQLGKTKPPWLENLNIFAYCFSPAFIIQLAIYFPEEHNFIKKYPILQFLPHIFSVLLFVLVRKASAVMAFAPKMWLIVATLYMVIAVLFFLGSCVILWWRSSSEMVRLRSKVILLGFSITASLPISDYLIRALFKIHIVPSYNYYLPFIFVFPVFVGYSIVKHDLFDIDAIIKRTYGYVLTTGALAGIYGIFVLISNLAFGGLEFAKSPVFPLIFILAMVFLFNPIRNKVQKFIDRVFYRLEYDYQATVQKISENMRTLLGLDQIGKAIMDTALGAMFIDSGYVMLQGRHDDTFRCITHSGEKDLGLVKSERGKSESEGANDEVEAPREKQVTADAIEMKAAADKMDLMLTDVTLPANDPFIRKLAEYQKEITIYDIQENPNFKDEKESCQKAFDQLGATLVVPVIYEDQLIGLISLGRKKSGKFFHREDINLLNILANQGAVAIENALMVEDVIEKERMEEELNIARDLQVSMLPAECPQIAGFEIAAYSLAAREVGGDFYDFIDMGEKKAGMLIGDVTGKSVSGALVMSASRSVFRMLSEEERSVAENMIRANRRIKKDVKSGMFVALLYAILDAENKTISLCSAGQTQPVVRSARTGETNLLETRGDTFPLGILEDAAYEETRMQLSPGDFVVLYTDGIVEAMNAGKEIFGFDRLLDIVKDSPAATAQSLLEDIRRSVNEFTGSAPQHDDITAIVIQAV